jgi:surface carbohydrate biosynthesis protein (TIGR04326 family)
MEYQPWEQMLNKILDDKTLTIGITHSAMRINLLNYIYHNEVHKYLYNPLKVLVNSKSFKQTMLNNGFDKKDIIPIEAQRFDYLNDVKISNNLNNNLLITTSIDYEETKELLEVFANAYVDKSFDKIFIKPHPDLDITSIINSISKFPKYVLLEGTIQEAFDLCNVVFTVNSSSVLLESLLYHKKTITFYSLKTLPMPAIKKHPLLCIAISDKELRDIFKSMMLPQMTNIEFKPFYLNKNMKLWKEFLSCYY